MIMKKLEIPVSDADIDELDVSTLMSVVDSKWYTDGKFHSLFKQRLISTTKSRHITLCNSGSSALLLATSACAELYNSKKNGKKYVITCATGFPTTIVPAIQAGFIPYFVDIDRKTLQINHDTVLDLLGNREVAGIIVAHTLGFPFPADLIGESVFEDQFFIEDCSDALGAKIKGFPVGTFSNASTYSFFPAHHITTGEGGAVGTDNGKLHKIIESYNNWGRDCWCKPGESNTCNNRFGHQLGKLPEGYDHKYTFSRLGFNLKMSEFQSALGSSQINRLPEFVEKRQINFLSLYDFLSCYEELDLIDWNYTDDSPSPFGFPITVNEKANFTRNELVHFLENSGIRTRPIFGGNLIRQPMMQEVPYLVAGEMKNSDYVMNNSFWIGCHPKIHVEELEYMKYIFQQFFKSRKM